MPKTPNPPPRALRIVVVHAVLPQGGARPAALDEQTRRGETLRAGLLPSGCDIVASLAADGNLAEAIARLQPDMIIADAGSDASDILEPLVIATGAERRPMVLFTEDTRTSSMDAAMAAGVSAYVVAGLRPERILPVLDVAMARFRQEQKLLAELSETRDKLAERKIIDRAKGLLMSSQRLSEDQAYQRLRTMAMNRNLKLSEIAQRIIDVEELL